MDADRADYLLRDSHFCGVNYGEYDYQRYVEMFAAKEDGESFKLIIEEKDIHIAEAFLIARYHYNMQVIFHRTRSGYDIALKEYMKNFDFKDGWFSIDDGILTAIDYDYFEYLDDYLFFQSIKDAAREDNYWAKCLMRQSHLKLVLDETNNLSSGRDVFKDFVKQLDSEGLELGGDFFVQQQKVDILKRTECGIHRDRFTLASSKSTL